MDEQQDLHSRGVIETARRLLMANGIDAQRFDEAAKEQRRQRERAWQVETPGNALTPTGEADVWLEGSQKQLSRFWAGRCVTCRHWKPDPAENKTPARGTCRQIAEPATDETVYAELPVVIHPTAAFGCILWDELSDPVQIRHRTELAMEIGLLSKMPDADGS